MKLLIDESDPMRAMFYIAAETTKRMQVFWKDSPDSKLEALSDMSDQRLSELYAYLEKKR